jgi:SAM-dependent methyltransferase
MEYRGVEIVCPACRGELREERGEPRLRCTRCGREYPIIADIPDLRLWPDPYIGMAEDRAKGLKLAAACASLSFADSVELYYRMTTVVPAFQAKAFTRALLAAAGRAAHSLARWQVACAGDTRALRLLEIGCGTAPLLVSAAPHYQQVAGVDVAFRWLVLARKRLEEAGSGAAALCACAEALPFVADSFDRVVADSTLEHLRDAELGLSEAERVLRARGCIFVATPNRWSLGPDPHAGLWAGGWLPDRVVGAYVKRKGGIPPKRRLFSAGSLRRSLGRAGFVETRVFVPDVPADQRAGFSPALRRVIDAYNTAVRTPPGRALLLRIGPLVHAVARKPATTELSATATPARRPA